MGVFGIFGFMIGFLAFTMATDNAAKLKALRKDVEALRACQGGANARKEQA